MALALTTRLLRPFARLGGPGPLFDKELRVASRRRRGYALRCVYVLFLMAFIAAIWIPTVAVRSGATSRAQMEAAAKTITMTIVWFQFFAAQLVAIAMLSTAISDEVYSRTLSTLLTTPLSDRQIVLNKLSSRLFQVLLLVATSLPLLAVVRVLGGIPWDFLIVSLCLTAATVVFAGSVSLLFSVLCRRSYIVAIVSVLVIASVFAIVPFIAGGLIRGMSSRGAFLTTTLFWNPFFLLYRFTDYAISPRQQLVSIVQIVSCCALLLSGSAVLLACSIRLVRSVALQRAMGEPTLLDRLKRKRFEEVPVSEKPSRKRRVEIRRVVGPPMVWKEMTCTLSRRERLAMTVVLGIEGLLIVIAYSFGALMAFLDYGMVHIMYIWAFLGLAVLFTITSSATVMSVERESRTWAVLLTTPLTDREILIGKFVGVLRRCGPIWLSLLAYVAAFTWAGCFRPMAIVHVVLISMTFLPFLSASGFYLGTRFHRTGEAVTANLVLAGVLWCLPPILGMLIDGVLAGHWSGGASVAFATVPFGEALAMVMTSLDGYSTDLRWFGGRLDASGMAVVMLVSMAAYMLASLGFMWRAVRGFRRRALD
jgi:ABC-type transport system involved in multi-copper enzyme maturation permease subunit